MTKDISEDLQYDLSRTTSGQSFQLTDVAYDIALADIPFILKIDNQNPYKRETAQYKKDQFDSSTEPGEQSLSGWWIRSQTSWHNGAGIQFYEPGTDKDHTTHRFKDSRGIDIWNTGELRLLKDTVHVYTNPTGHILNSASGYDKTLNVDVLVLGDDDGVLRRIALNGDSAVDDNDYYTNGGTYVTEHDASHVYGFHSIATDGSTYYAACDRMIHRGTINNLTSDTKFFKHSTSSTSNVIVKYAKGDIFVGMGSLFGLLDTAGAATTQSHTSGSAGTFSNYMTHINDDWNWVDATGSPGPLFFAGSNGKTGEVWMASLSNDPTVPGIDLSTATLALALPDGEYINAIKYYLGHLAIGTNKGVRVCQVDLNGNPLLGPLVVETDYPVNGFTERGSYIYAATKSNVSGVFHATLIRIDLANPFDDGTFAYAYDLEYQSTPDSTDCTEVYNIEDRLVMVIEENGTGELIAQHTTNYRTSGWLETGKIRFGTVEPKFFKYLQTRGLIATGDSISINVIDNAGASYDIIDLDETSISENVQLSYPIGSQEFISIRFTLTNGSPVTDYPVLQSYQLKAIPGVIRQRLYQYPLSCFDIEMDKYNIQFGYSNRAYEVLTKLEELETLGDFISVKDFRTGEQYKGVIEEVRFSSESSPDKDSNGFGGTLIVTVRKL